MNEIMSLANDKQQEIGMKIGSAALPCLALITYLGLSACGGSGNHVASNPSPPAAPSYDSFAELNKNVTLATTSSAVSYSYGPLNGTIPGSVARDPKGGFGEGSISISYDAASRTYTLHDGSNATSYAPADKTAAAPGADPTPFDTYRRAVNNVSDTVLAYRVGNANTQFPQLSYTTFVVGRHEVGINPTGLSYGSINSRVVYAIGGFETLRSDLPKSGTASYATFTTGSAIDAGRDVGGSATLTADFGAGTVATSLALIAGGQAIGTFTGTAPIEAATAHFRGDLSANNATQGNFSGSFFGPQGTEVGYTYRVQSSIGTVDGGAVGKK